jgi:hypothetical protein
MRIEVSHSDRFDPPFSILKEFTVKKKNKRSEKKLQSVAEKCTFLIATEGVSAEDALVIVLDMLRYHSSLVMDPDRHEAFVEGVVAVLRREVVTDETGKADLGESLNSYIDPTSPEFDAAFALEIIRLRSDWFTNKEIEAVKTATRHL